MTGIFGEHSGGKGCRSRRLCNVYSFGVVGVGRQSVYSAERVGNIYRQTGKLRYTRVRQTGPWLGFGS